MHYSTKIEFYKISKIRLRSQLIWEGCSTIFHEHSLQNDRSCVNPASKITGIRPQAF